MKRSHAAAAVAPLAAAGPLLLAAVAGAQKPAAPTFSGEVAPLLYKNCTPCHRPGAIAPFPLVTYGDAQKRAELLALVTEKRTMPPWKPDSHGEFRDEKRLTPAEIGMLRRWAEAGAPQGDPAAAPAPPRFREGWQIGTPDLVLEMPADFAILAEGPDLYQHFVFPLDLPRDRYVRAVEVIPGNPRVAHHAIGLLDTSKKARELDRKTPEPGYGGFGGPGFLPAGFTPGYVPGATARAFDEGSALTFKKGADFVLQMHYHPIGRPQTDRTRVGIYFTDRKPTRSPNGVLPGSEDIDIPAGAKAHAVDDTFTLPTALTVTALWPHMHMVGKDVRVWAELPDGSRRKLLHIPDWDFAWQDTYLFKEPVRLPKGTKVRARFTYDNSADNPRNPNSPPRRVLIGEGSTDEMAGMWVGGYADDWGGDLALVAANVGHYLEVHGKGDRARKAAEAGKKGAAPARR